MAFMFDRSMLHVMRGHTDAPTMAANPAERSYQALHTPLSGGV
jgi:hypothetical protein